MKPAIANGHAVTIHFRLTLSDGTIAGESFGGEPLVYLHGQGDIVPGLERELTGKGVGDQCEVTLEPADGYGEYDPMAEQSVPRSQFLPNGDIQPGMSFQVQGSHGPMSVWVREVEGEQVVVTSNHPLAGQRLTFKVQVLDVREAKSDTEPAPGAG